MSCCFRYLSLLARRTLAVVVLLGYKVRNCYALSVTHFIRRPLRSYAVTHFISDPWRRKYVGLPNRASINWYIYILIWVIYNPDTYGLTKSRLHNDRTVSTTGQPDCMHLVPVYTTAHQWLALINRLCGIVRPHIATAQQMMNAFHGPFIYYNCICIGVKNNPN